jgi:PEP-CTERM motif
MKMNKLLACILAVTASSASMADMVLSEGFDNVAALAGKGWVISNLSTPVGASSWFQGNAEAGSASGPAGSHIGANFLNADIDGGTVSNWLFTPVMNTETKLRMDFALRLLGSGFLDTVEVYYSLAGNSTNVANFNLLNSYASDVDTGWALKSETLEFLSGTNSVRFAFRYYVANTLSAGNYVGIDSVNINSVPEPLSAALVGVGLLGAAAARRRRD